MEDEDVEGILMSCGRSTENQLGYLTREHVQRTFRPIRGLSRIKQVSAGDSHVLALDALGRIWAWGQNARGCLGVGDLFFRALPTQLTALSAERVVCIGTGLQANYSACVTNSGTLYCWGDNTHGQFGALDAPAYSPSPRLTALPVKVSKLACGEKHMLLLNEQGQVFSAGCNASGACGNTMLQRHVKFLPVPAPFDQEQTGIACGTDTSYAWNELGEVRLLNAEDQHALSFRDFSVRIRQVVCSATHVLFLAWDGRVFSRRAHKRGPPERVDDDMVHVGCGGGGMLGCVDEQGRVYTWGKGQGLGFGLEESSSGIKSPTLVESVWGGAKQICFGRDFALVLISFQRERAAFNAGEFTLTAIAERRMVATMDAFNFLACFEYATKHNFAPESTSALEQVCMDFILANYNVLKMLNPSALAQLCIEQEEEQELEEEEEVHPVETKEEVQTIVDAVVVEEEEAPPVIAMSSSPPPVLTTREERWFCDICNVECIDRDAHEQGRRHRSAFRLIYGDVEPSPSPARASSQQRKGKKQVFPLHTSTPSPSPSRPPAPSAPWSIPPKQGGQASFKPPHSLRELLKQERGSTSTTTTVNNQTAASVSPNSLPLSASWGETSKLPAIKLQFTQTVRNQVVTITKPRAHSNSEDKPCPPGSSSLRDIFQLEQLSSSSKTSKPLQRSAWGYLPKS